MKKILFVSIFALMFSMFASAQVNPNAIGLRFGGGSLGGAEVSYQKGLGSNRLELDFGWGGNSNHSRMYLSGIFHWNWNIVEGLNWYVGPGASIGYYQIKNGNDYLGAAVEANNI